MQSQRQQDIISYIQYESEVHPKIHQKWDTVDWGRKADFTSLSNEA